MTTSDDRNAADFSLESPDLEEGVGIGDGGESDSDDDVAFPEINEIGEEDLNSPSLATETNSTTVTVALPAGSAVPISVIPIDSNPKWRSMTEIVHQRPPIDDSRRLFQRLWTDEDEIELLRGFLDYTTAHRGSSSHPPDTAPFYEQIKSKLQLDFNKNQLVEKLRRLKKKYRNVMSKISSGKDVFFKSPHDQSTFDISKRIWNQTGKVIGFEDNNNNNNNNVIDLEETNNYNSPVSNHTLELDSDNIVEKRFSMSSGSRKRSRSRIGKIQEDNNKPIITPFDAANNNVNLNDEPDVVGGDCIGGKLGGLVEETVRSCVSPVIKEMMNGATSVMMATMGGFHGLGSLRPVFTQPLSFGFGGGNKTVTDERWRKQQILELEVYSRRLELVQEQIRSTIHELKTTPT